MVVTGFFAQCGVSWLKKCKLISKEMRKIAYRVKDSHEQPCVALGLEDKSQQTSNVLSITTNA